MILEKQYTIEQFMNNLESITSDLVQWNIIKVYRKDQTEHKFLSWDKTKIEVHPMHCDCEFNVGDNEDFKCDLLEIP